mgnify:FL=1
MLGGTERSTASRLRLHTNEFEISRTLVHSRKRDAVGVGEEGLKEIGDVAEGVFVGGKEVGSAVREGESAGLAVSGPEKKLAVSREVIELNPSTRQLRKKAGREDARSPPDSGSQAGRDGLLGVAEDAEVRDNQLQIRRAKGRNALVESRQPRARSTGSAGSVARDRKSVV